jgi:TonB family protein
VEARSAVRPVPLGRPDGSPAGVASLALDVSNFPFTWYLQQVQRKVTEKWVQPNQTTGPGLRVVVLFEIARDGQVTNSKVEQTSGNSWYDQSALRAVVEANPFPPLPEGFPGKSLRVHFGFDFKSS